MVALMLSISLMMVIAPVGVQGTRSLIDRALDQPATIGLDNIRLKDAIKVVTKQTGVPIVMGLEAMRLVPQGADTLINRVDIASMPLREGLRRLFAPLGMRCVIESDRVSIEPRASLLALGRVPTWPELGVLNELFEMQPGIEPEALKKLRSRVQFRVAAADAWQLLARAIRNVGRGPGDEVLTIACRGLGWGWTLTDDRIIVSSVEDQVRRRLAQPISLRMNNRSLFDVMTAVGDAVHVKVRAEAGALVALPVQTQHNFSLNAHQEPAGDVLDTIAAYTGLGYLIGPDGVVFYRGSDTPPAKAAAQLAEAGQGVGTIRLFDPYVAKIVIPIDNGRSIEWLIRRSEMPEDLRKMRDRDVREGFELLRKTRASGSP